MSAVPKSGIPNDVALVKITPPRRAFLSIDRDEALETLEDCLQWKIVTVGAPVGSARSSFLAEAYRRLGGKERRWRTAWLAVDEADDRERLYRHVLAALRTIWPELEADELMRLYREKPSLSQISLSNFLLEHAVGSGLDFVLFVDDLDKAVPDAIAELLNTAARFYPENVRIVASGGYLLWEYVDLAFRDEVRAFPSERLNFSRSEVKRLLSQATGCRGSLDAPYAPDQPIRLEDEDLEALAESLWTATGGWPFGVRTYIDAFARGSVDFSVPIDERALGQMLNRFFRSNVLDVLDEKLDQFVIDVALTDTICADLCNALTGRNDAKFVLRELQTKGCFLDPCPGEPGWYEFHPLFHRWLRMKQGQMDIDRLRDLCWTASGWYEEHGMMPQAAKYLLMASDHEFIENLSSASGYDVQREGTTYFEWIGRVPADELAESSQLALQATWGYVVCGRVSNGWRWADAFERATAREAGKGRPDVSTVASLVRTKCVEMECRYDEAIEMGESLFERSADEMSLSQRCLLLHMLAEAYVRRGRFDEALKHYLQAEAVAELIGFDFIVALCRTCVVSLFIDQGKYKEALQLCEKALDDCPDTVMTYGSLLACKGYLYAESNRLEEALDCVEQAHRIVSTSRNVDMLYEVEAERAWCYALVGQHAQAFRLITKTSLQMGGNSVARSIHLLVYLRQAWIALLMGYVSEAKAAVDKLKERIGDGDVAYELAYLAVRAAVDDASGTPGVAADVLPLVERAHDAGLGLYELQLSIRAADRLEGEGRHADALFYMNRALRLQSGQQFVGPFLHAGGRTRTLLHEIVDIRKSGGQTRLLAKEVLRCFGSSETEEEASSRSASPIARFGLTEREQEVLELLDAGLSRREIADRLTVSPNTVKTHVSGIYSKLGVTNRIDAFSVVHGIEEE